MENASVFYLSGFQYIFLAVVVTKGYPHKKPLYHNGRSPRFSSESISSPNVAGCEIRIRVCFPAVIFLCIVLILLAVMSWLVLSPGAFVCGIFKLFDFQYMDFKLLLLALAALNFFVCFIVEVSDGASQAPNWSKKRFHFF